MLTWIREKFGTVVIGGIISLIAFVFVFYGVFSPKSTRGIHQGSVAGEVNGEPITLNEFNRELNRRMEFFKNMGGGKLSEEQLKAFRLREGVFQELVRRRLLIQQALKRGMVASDEEVKERIREMPYFQKDGRFDLPTYKQVLEANNHSPGSFERLVREDLSLQQWEEYFRRRSTVSEEEIRREFLLTEDKRDIKYVLLTADAGRKGVQVAAADVAKFLSEASKLNLARSRYEAGKNGEYKGKTFELVKDSIAKDILASEKAAEVQKVVQSLADQVLALLKAEKASDAKLNALLKAYGSEVRSTGKVTRANKYLPGIGESSELLKDAFATKSPIDPAQGGKAKKYTTPAWTVVAIVTEADRPVLSRLSAEKDKLHRQISTRKEQQLFEGWMKQVREKADIDPNPAVVSDG